MRRFGLLLVVLAIVATACVDPGIDAGDDPGVIPAISSTTSRAPVSQPSSTVPGVSGSFVLPPAIPATGDAPIVVAGVEPGVVSSIEMRGPGDVQTLNVPDGTRLWIESCFVPYPGVVTFALAWGPPASAGLPLSGTVALSFISGDVVVGSLVDVVLEEPGEFSVSVPVRTWTVDGDRDTFIRRLEQGRQWVDASRCSAGFFYEDFPGTASAEIESRPQPLVITAPEGSMEALAQSIPSTEDAELQPVQLAYVRSLPFFADVFYIPDDPPTLESIRETLDESNTCVTLQFLYDGYTVTQERGCRAFARTGTWEAGGTTFATAYGSGWDVLVSGPSPQHVEDLLSRLQPYTVLRTKPIPITPGGEQLIGRTTFDGADIVITLGEQHCGSSCSGPEQWIYLYTVDDGEVVPYAGYPAWGECALVEEDPWTLAVAEPGGSVEIVVDGRLETIGSTGLLDDRPFALVPAGTVDEVRVLDRNGVPPACTRPFDGDHLGGIVDSPAVTSTTSTTEQAETTGAIVIEPCGYLPPYPQDLTDEPMIANGCVETPMGKRGVGRFVPGGIFYPPEDGPPPGDECLADWRGMEVSGGPCRSEGVEFSWSGGATSSGGLTWALGYVSEDTERVIAVTDRGREIVAIPYERMVFLWWQDGATLTSVVAETPDGDVDLLELGM